MFCSFLKPKDRCTMLRMQFSLQVTPSSKVVGDLAQFMVQNDLDDTLLVEKAANLNLPARWGTLNSVTNLTIPLCHSGFDPKP